MARLKFFSFPLAPSLKSLPITGLHHLVNKANLVHSFSWYVYSFLYMFQTTICPSSEEITVSIRHLVFVTLCRWLSGTQGHPHTVTNTKCRIDTVISDSWIKRDQLDVTCFIISLFNTQHVSDVNTSILRSLRLMCWVISWVVLFWFDVCCCYVVVWLWWCGIRKQAEALVPQPAYGYHTTTAKPQRNSNTHRTRKIQPMK